MKKQLLVSVTIFLLLILGTTIVVLYGKGYRFWFEKGRPDISGTGLLVVTSVPDGAQVFIDDHLTTATDSTINLSPGQYSVRIYKDGYFPWQKKIEIQKEVVIKIEASLFAVAPKLESITTTGVSMPILDPSRSKIAYTVASGSARKNGIYILDLAARSILTLQSSSTQIADDTSDLFSNANSSWSPDGKELIASISSTLRRPIYYLLDSSDFNTIPKDITATLSSILANWNSIKAEKDAARENALKPQLEKVLAENFSVIEWSPDETKILYTASQSATIPIIIKPPLIGANQTKEERDIKKDAVYVYDIKEDKNFKLFDALPNYTLYARRYTLPLNWMSNSSHLLFVKDKKIHIVEYDGENDTIVYAGPFLEKYVFPSTNESKIVIVTDLGNPDISPNLYTLELK